MTAAGGRTLGLFSSMRAAKQATEELRKRTDLPILCQGEDSTALLVRKFAEDEASCLFGTLSLWQGVDVPGPSLQLVIVDRIPFPRPDDPLASARQRAVEARGGNGFLSVAATHAALLLAQGTGRLLRSIDDRGVVAILDPRLATARYGGFLRSSLPELLDDDRPGGRAGGPAPPRRGELIQYAQPNCCQGDCVSTTGDAGITVDDDGVRRQLADGTEESVTWAKLSEVAIRTTPEGPWKEDVFFLLVPTAAAAARSRQATRPPTT